MKTPFPGMDPYLEQEGIWNQVHTSLIVELQRFLAPLVQPNYKAIIEQLTYLTLSPTNGNPKPTFAGRPDNLIISPHGYQPSSPTATAVATAVAAPVAVKPLEALLLPMPEQHLHRYLQIKDKYDEVITVIEILSPVNKIGVGREQYLQKRDNILGSLTHLVEIDLLRMGEPLPMEVAGKNHYRIVVSRSEQRPTADAYLFSVREPIPDFPIPLRAGDVEPMLKLNEILHQVYQLGYYATLVDYDKPLRPSLADEDMAWVKGILHK